MSVDKRLITKAGGGEVTQGLPRAGNEQPHYGSFTCLLIRGRQPESDF